MSHGDGRGRVFQAGGRRGEGLNVPGAMGPAGQTAPSPTAAARHGPFFPSQGNQNLPSSPHPTAWAMGQRGPGAGGASTTLVRVRFTSRMRHGHRTHGADHLSLPGHTLGGTNLTS